MINAFKCYNLVLIQITPLF